MTRRTKIVLGVVAGAGLWELGWWARRYANRGIVYRQALQRAYDLGRPLVVVGAPDLGATRGPGCGDVTVDIRPSRCPNSIQVDISKDRLPFTDAGVVVYVSCVLEYVSDVDAALRELCRVSGGELFIVRVEPWTLASRLYPGARNRLATATVLNPCRRLA